MALGLTVFAPALMPWMISKRHNAASAASVCCCKLSCLRANSAVTPISLQPSANLQVRCSGAQRGACRHCDQARHPPPYTYLPRLPALIGLACRTVALQAASGAWCCWREYPAESSRYDRLLVDAYDVTPAAARECAYDFTQWLPCRTSKKKNGFLHCRFSREDE